MSWLIEFLTKERSKLYATLVYLPLLLLLRREFSFTLLAGGLVGFLFLPVLKLYVKSEDEKRILESVAFQAPLAVLTYYATSSLTGGFGHGFILTLFLQTLLSYDQSWFWPVKGGVSRRVSIAYFFIMVAVFLYSTLLVL